MKKINKLILIILIFLNHGNNLSAQQKQDGQLKFSGSVKGTGSKGDYEKLYINYNTNNWFSESGHVSIIAKIDSNGNFEFNLPDLNKPYKIGIAIMGVNKAKGKKLWSNDYYVESHDTVKMAIVLDNDSALFSGRGHEKYNLVSKLKRQFWDDYYSDLGTLHILSVKDTEELDLKMEKLAVLLKKYMVKKSSLINAANISSDMKVILSHEYARYSAEWPWRAECLYRGNPTYRKAIVQDYLRYSKELYDKPDRLSGLCHMYFYGISLKDSFEQMISKNSETVDMVSFYNSRKANYSGVVRDRLIAHCFFSRPLMMQYAPFAHGKMDSLLIDASAVVVVPPIRKAITDQLKKSARVYGKKLFASEFTMPDGKKFDLKSLRGRVAVIDVWFNGCFGCANFHKVFENEIYPEFKDNKNFVVLSINIDDKKERWQTGISSKTYTSEKYINVWTGNGLNHPFIKHYSIIGAPYLMLIDAAGNVRYQPNGSTVPIWIAQIKDALKSSTQ